MQKALQGCRGTLELRVMTSSGRKQLYKGNVFALHARSPTVGRRAS